MSVVIAANLVSLRLQTQLKQTTSALGSVYERLGSGLRINSGSDDPAGLALADRLTTVSPTYASEIRTAAHGMGLDGLLRTRAHQGRLAGILNGIDTADWNPMSDVHLAHNFNARAMAGKRKTKQALQRELSRM